MNSLMSSCAFMSSRWDKLTVSVEFSAMESYECTRHAHMTCPLTIQHDQTFDLAQPILLGWNINDSSGWITDSSNRERSWEGPGTWEGQGVEVTAGLPIYESSSSAYTDLRSVFVRCLCLLQMNDGYITTEDITICHMLRCKTHVQYNENIRRYRDNCSIRLSGCGFAFWIFKEEIKNIDCCRNKLSFCRVKQMV
jgi:hypothetical protein